MQAGTLQRKAAAGRSYNDLEALKTDVQFLTLASSGSLLSW